MLLRRYGIVFRRLLERETLLVPWRDVLRVYRRLEARGEIRGGRFVGGFSGEQYALPEAVGTLRAVRREEPRGSLVAVSGADPLNLVGIIVPGDLSPRSPATGCSIVTAWRWRCEKGKEPRLLVETTGERPRHSRPGWCGSGWRRWSGRTWGRVRPVAIRRLQAKETVAPLGPSAVPRSRRPQDLAEPPLQGLRSEGARMR